MSLAYYIGISTSFHDPSISIIDDTGKIVFAESTERYLQLKRGIGCTADPVVWIEEVLDTYCNPNANFYIAGTWSSKNKKLIKIITFLLGYSKKNKGILSNAVLSLFSPIFTKEEIFWINKLHNVSTLHPAQSTEKVLRTKFKVTKVNRFNFDHHETHAATACYFSSFKQAVCLVMDGSGEKGSFSYYKYHNGKITRLGYHKGNESLGIFYMLITELCGFDSIKGEEWKVMGLSAYGKKDAYIYTRLKKLYTVSGLKIKWSLSNKKIKILLNEIREYIEASKDSEEITPNIAYTGQLVFTEYMNHFLTNLYDLNISENLIYTGGCALNSAYNGKITSETPFKKVHIPPCPGDDGNSIGAAYLSYLKFGAKNKMTNFNWNSPYLGSFIQDQEIEKFLRFSTFEKYSKVAFDQLVKIIAQRIADGKIVGWVQGRSEFGPRALGNRSILADPRDKRMKDKLNSLVKFREEFRPFAPSILEEHAPDYIENYEPSYYMERTLKFNVEVLEKIPSVVHEDATGRLQTVSKELNPLYHGLISEFYKKTGIPLLINTSLNVMGKPIMHSFSDAMTVFLNSGMDILVVNNYIFEKTN